VTEVELLVAVLGASNYTYAEATRTQQIPDWLASHQRAFQFFGGRTTAVVCDQLKRASPWRAGTSRGSKGPTRSSRSITAP
jgi:transposase